MSLDPAGAKQSAAELCNLVMSSAPVRAVINRYTINTEELRSVADADDNLTILKNRENQTFNPPICLDPVPDPISLHVGEHVIEDKFIASIQNCQLLGPKAVPVTADNRFLLENVSRSESLLVRSLIEIVRSGMVPKHRDTVDMTIDHAVSLVGPWAGGYFHWFSEWLPRLEAIEQFTDQNKPTPTVIIPSNPPQWMRESLNLAGFNDYIPWNKGCADVAELLVPSLRRSHPINAPEQYANAGAGYQWVKRRILRNLDSVSDLNDNPRGIYISRRRADERQVVNESDVMNVLADYGFKLYELEELSFSNQVRLFRQADAVVAPHGAGLINAIYGTNLSILELFGDYINGCYYTMAESLGFNYGCLTCESIGSSMRVDVNRLEELLNQVL